MAIKHGVHDTDTHFIIDPITRAAKNDGLKKVSIVRDDHNSEVCTFELPKYVEGHDMSQCNKVEVHYLNTHGTTKTKSTGIYVVTDFGQAEDDPDKVVGSWLIDCLATKYPGSLAFSIHFACVDDDTGTVAYWWSSAINTSISVLDSVNLTESGGGGGGSVEESDLQEKTATPAEVPQVIRPDNGFYGLSKVTVEAIPDEYVTPSGSLFVGANGTHDVKKYESVLVNVPPTLEDKTFTANGTYTPSIGFDGFGKVDVNITDAPAVLQEKTVYPATFDQSVEPDAGFDGLSKVTMGAMRLQSVTVDSNGEVIPSHGYDGLASVTVNVKDETKQQSKSMTFTENGDTEIVPDSGFTGLSSVKVKVNVEGAGKLQTKVIKTNGEHKPDDEYDGFELVKTEVPQHVYTGVEKTYDQAVFGSPLKNIVICGQSAVASAQASASDGVLYQGLRFDLMTVRNDYNTVISNGALTMDVIQGPDGSSRVYLYQNGAAITNVVTWDMAQTGFKIKWNVVCGPENNEKFPNGWAGVTITFQYKKSAEATTLNYLDYGFDVGFKSVAECNAAKNLVAEQTTIIQINEEVFYPGTEA